MSAPKSRRHEVARAAKLNEKVRLSQITLFEISARHLARLEGLEPTFSFSMRPETVLYTEEKDETFAAFPLRVTIEHKGEQGKVALGEIHVVVRVIYRREPTWQPEDADLFDDYLGIVGWMHAWPYLRAEVQSLSTKLTFPPLILPVLLAGQTADVGVQRVGDELAKEPSAVPKVVQKRRRTKAAKSSPA